MHGLALGVIGACLASLWLVLLAATDFNAVAISVGLLVMVGLIGEAK